MARVIRKASVTAPGRVLRIGVMPVSEMRARTIAIARGELKPSPSDPKVWISSAEAAGKILSPKNVELLEHIRRSRPTSLQALSSSSGRKVPSLSRTLRLMEKYGIVKLEPGERGALRPEVPFDELDLQIRLSA